MPIETQKRKPFIFYVENKRCNEDEILVLLDNFEATMKRATLISASKLWFDLKQTVHRGSLLYPFTLTMERQLINSEWQWQGTFEHDMKLKVLHVMGMLLEP